MNKIVKIEPIDCVNRPWYKRWFIHNQCFILKKDVYFVLMINTTRHIFKIPKGFIYDGASIPWFIWNILNLKPSGVHDYETLIHDWIYVNKGLLKNIELENVKISRKMSDRIYYVGLIQKGISLEVAELVYKKIRKLGWLFWFDSKLKFW